MHGLELTCPHCGWSMKVNKQWVDTDGYHGQFSCRYGTCQVSGRTASTDLFWAYENNKIKIRFAIRSTRYFIQPWYDCHPSLR